jgi:hypothetical protein
MIDILIETDYNTVNRRAITNKTVISDYNTK